MRKIKILLLTAVFVILGTSAFAEDATVTFVSGKVEVQRGGKWVALQKGDSVAKSETISTGFQSEAKIKILDSVMYLGPVTRITLEELSSSGQKDNVNVYLKTGTTRSQVRHTDNKRVNYQVHTAVAVASCRGTDWVMDDSNSVSCLEGTVAVAAYKAPPATGDDGQTENEETEDKSEDETEGSEDKTETSETETEGTTESTDDKRTTPSSDEGVLVKANQSVTVSETSSVSTPVVTVVQTASAVTATVAPAGEKEGVGGAGVSAGSAAPAATTTAATTSGASTSSAGTGTGSGAGTGGSGSGSGAEPAGPTTATVTVTVELPSDM